MSRLPSLVIRIRNMPPLPSLVTRTINLKFTKIPGWWPILCRSLRDLNPGMGMNAGTKQVWHQVLAKNLYKQMKTHMMSAIRAQRQ